MKKMCVMICGTNRSGKTTVAKAMLDYYGGEGERKGWVTYSADGKAAHVDADKTHATTAVIPPRLKEVYETADVAFVEGIYLGTFGKRCTDIIFCAEKQLYVFLYCNKDVLAERKKARPSAYGDFWKICDKQRQCLRAAQRYATIGVPVISFDTGKASTEEIVTAIAERMKKIYGGGG